ncbi:hypothetical protein HYT33_02965 [Candidatus Roizmanbacteria bacterium]|nr:hypothetical protein [Candidatus Roizmanbacteria bacterium]
MLTKADFEKLEKRFVTKEEFHEGLKVLTDEIIELFHAFRKEFRQEFVDLRKELRAVIENHERRTSRLEDKVFS